NKFAQEAREAKLKAREDLLAPQIGDLLRLDDAAFRILFSRGPVRRIGFDRFMQNVLIAAGNSGDPSLAPLVEEKLSSRSPLVRAMAVWALGQLAPQDQFAEIERRWRCCEKDAMVEAEWAEATSVASCRKEGWTQ
ncbi:MAG: HEAT repeat domain-containing protein, partial [Methylocapsa sp.]|nr:HEAT repeat domain-containing protein [Methylocapsa sp.]